MPVKFDAKALLETYLRLIDHISNKHYQNKAWIKGEGVDFDELVCLFFEGDPILEDYRKYNLSDNQYHILKNFRDEFKQYSRKEYREPIEFIDSPEWAKIMARAKEVLKAFNYPSNS